jgi:hypothetical protein
MIHVGLRHQKREILALQGRKHFRQPLGKRRRNSLEGFIEQQTFGADAKRPAKRDQLLLASAQQ